MRGKERALAFLNNQEMDKYPLYGDIEDLKILRSLSCISKGDLRKSYIESCKSLGIDITRGYSACFEIERYDKTGLKGLKDDHEILSYFDSIKKDTEFREIQETVGEDIHNAGDDVLILPQVKWSIFGDLVYVMGYEDFSMSLYREDVSTIDLVDIIFSHVLEDMSLLSSLDEVGSILYMDDIAYDDGLLYHPDSIKRYFTPYLEEMARISHEMKLKLIFHSHGDVTSLLDDILDTGIDGFIPMDNRWDDVLKVLFPRNVLLIRSISDFR